VQRAFLLQGTPHAECPSDIAIKKTLLNAFDEYGADKIITGSNKLEGTHPPEWSVVDGLYLKDVVRRHGEKAALKTFPNMSLWDHIRYKRKTWAILDEMDYDPVIAKEHLEEWFGWKGYGAKHYENIYTKFNQGLRYFKFGIDMRTIEIGTNYDLSKPPYPYEEWLELADTILLKLDLRLDQILTLHGDWKRYRSYRKWILRIKKIMGK